MPLNNTRLTQWLATAITAGALLGSAATAATAGDRLISEIKAGVLAHDVPDLWSGFQRESDAVDINVELAFSPRIPFLMGAIYPALGATVNTGGDTSHVYLDARWQIDTPSGIFFGIGLGAAVHDGEINPSLDAKGLGSRVLFHIPAEIGVRLDAVNSLSVYFEHTSNGELAKYNEGLDRIGIRYGYRF